MQDTTSRRRKPNADATQALFLYHLILNPTQASSRSSPVLISQLKFMLRNSQCVSVYEYCPTMCPPIYLSIAQHTRLDVCKQLASSNFYLLSFESASEP